MKFLRLVLVGLIVLMNFAIAPPSWAGKDFTKGADYTEVTQEMTQLLQAQNTPEQLGYTQEALQQRLAALQIQQQIIQTASKRAQCRNATNHKLAVYANLPKKTPTSIYFLEPGKITDDDWDCDGVYLPTGTIVATNPTEPSQPLTTPIAFKIVDGTQLVASTNFQTGAIEFNVLPAKQFHAGEVAWAIPNWTQAQIDANPVSQEILD